MDSARPSVASNLPRGEVYLGEVKLDPPSDGSGLKSKKWILAMFIESIASIFTVLGILTADQWLWLTGAIAAGYGIFNVGQKKLLQ